MTDRPAVRFLAVKETACLMLLSCESHLLSTDGFWMDLSLAESIRQFGFCRDKGGPILILALICSQESSGEPGNHSVGESEASTVVCGVGSFSKSHLIWLCWTMRAVKTVFAYAALRRDLGLALAVLYESAFKRAC